MKHKIPGEESPSGRDDTGKAPKDREQSWRVRRRNPSSDVPAEGREMRRGQKTDSQDPFQHPGRGYTLCLAVPVKESSRTLRIKHNRTSRKKKTKLGPVQSISEGSSETVGSFVSEGKGCGLEFWTYLVSSGKGRTQRGS